MILDDIIQRRNQDVAQLKKEFQVSDYQQLIGKTTYNNYSLREALESRQQELPIIAEVKKASPSKGIICETFNPLSLAIAYEKGGAAAISVLTEPHFFLGDNSYLTTIKKNVKLPLLRKDFIVDPLQIYESKAIGADAILLIVAVLTDEALQTYLNIAHELGMEALVETHCEKEIIRAVAAGAKLIGINNRNLKNFHVDITTSQMLSKVIPKDKIVVAESGIWTREDVERLKESGVNALLVGESLAKSKDPIRQLHYLRGEE